MSIGVPQPLTSFVGRDWELKELGALLARHRLVTLVGTGGCGKTRLAIELARRYSAVAAGRVWFVDLAAVASSQFLEEVVAKAVSVPPSVHDGVVNVVARLSEGPCLLLLDTCEHLVESCAAMIDRLLRDTDSLRVLATSRQPLRVAGELRWTVPSLAFPEAGSVLPLSELEKLESVQLFVDRTRLSRAQFKLDPANAPAVAAICTRLDGIPLAIELAAAWIRVLAPAEVARRLDEGFGLLTADRGVTPRHLTLEKTIQWSYELLGDDERALLNRLAVFAGTFDVSACEEVCSSEDWGRNTILQTLAGLVDQSMVEVVASGTRYRLLDTIHDYARVRLAESEEPAKYDRRHAMYYLGIADSGYRGLRGPGRLEWQHRLESEAANLRKALDWANTHDPEIALRLAYLVAPFHMVRMTGADVRQADAWLAQALADPAAGSTFRGWALTERGWLTWRQGDVSAAETYWKSALESFRLAGDEKGVGETLSQLGEIAGARGDLSRSRRWFEEGLTHSQRAGDKWMVAYTRFYLGLLAIREGQSAAAVGPLEESLDVWRAIGDDLMMAYPIAILGFAALELNDFAEARSRFETALAITRGHGYDWGNAALLQFFAALAVALKDSQRAILLIGAAETAFERIRSAPSPFLWPALEPRLRQAQKNVGPEEASALTDEGRQMTLDQALALVESMPRNEPPRPGGLSKREIEVVELVAQGLASKEIATHLGISARTAETHIDHIRVKLGLRSKAHVAAWAIEHGLRP